MIRSFVAGALALLAVPAAAREAPRPPAGAAAGYAPPERDAGGYLTPNRGVAADEAVWHVRVALNVAALGCRDGADLAPAYNAMLAAEEAPLAAAIEATRARYRARHGEAWQARFDDDMTRLYNFFAQPPAHDGFCQAAAALLSETRALPPEAFAAAAAAALPRLEAPFLAFFAAYDDYRAALADWRRAQPPLVIAAAAPAPVGPRPPMGPEGD